MYKALVTGGAGFIGSHIIEGLLKEGFSVIAIDNLSLGKMDNITDLHKQNNLEFVEGSITDLKLLRKVFSGVHYVFHQAAIPDLSDNGSDVGSYYENNSRAILNILQAAMDNNVTKVICASSCAVYGNDPILPKREDMLPEPESPYAVTKIILENYCNIFNKIYNVPTICLRYFNVYGPRQNPASSVASVIPKFIQRISRGDAPVVFGDGQQTRDFVYIKDVVSANIKVAESDCTGIYNIGSGEGISLNRLIEIIFKLFDCHNIQTVYKDEVKNEIRHSVADISKSRSFGYKPEYSLEEGLKEIIKSVK